MSHSTMRYLLIRIYGNDELCTYLTDLMEKGWVIDHCLGNFLFFRRQTLKNARLLVISAECSKRKAAGDEQVNEYIDIALKHGWQLLCIGDFESVIPMRRRLYFYTQSPEATPLPPDEAIDFQYAHRAYHSTLRWIIIWTLLFAAAAVSTFSFMLAEGAYFVLILIDAALLALSVSSVFLFINRRALYRHVTKGLPLPPRLGVSLRRWEVYMTAALAALFVGLVWLLIV